MTKGNNSEKKHKPIPEALIRARAYENWKIRQREGKDGSPEDDWSVAKESLKLERDCLKLRYFWWLLANPKSQSFTLEIVKIFISAFGIIATISGGIVLYFNYLNSQERLINERFSKAVEQLGSQEEAVRIGGIYALERIAKDSPKDHWTIMEVLTSYIRQQSPLPEKRTEEELKKLQRVSIDVQAALTVIGRRNSKQDPKGNFLDLNSTNLYRADLKKANLRQAYLLRANLKQAYLENADLEGAFLHEASLQEAYLGESRLRKIDIQATNLKGANIERADFRESADLTPKIIKSACNWQQAIYKGEKKANQEFIKVLKNDRSSDPKEPVNCRMWNSP